MSDWQSFIDSVPWFMDDRAKVLVEGTQDGYPLLPEAAAAFPALSGLFTQCNTPARNAFLAADCQAF